MQFASSLYSSVTAQFFDLLVTNTNQQFEERCRLITQQGKYTSEYSFDECGPEEHDHVSEGDRQRQIHIMNHFVKAQSAPLEACKHSEEKDIWQFKEAAAGSRAAGREDDWRTLFLESVRLLQTQ